MKVLFRVEAYLEIGLGHIMRCSALAQTLRVEGHEVCFVLSERTLKLYQSRLASLGEVFTFPSANIATEPQRLVNKCESLNVDWLIVDGYEFAQDYRYALHKKKFKLGIFDDVNDSGALYADLVINGAIKADVLNYQQTAPNASLALGDYYRILRPEFLQLADRSWSVRTHLTIMFGGSDPQNLTLSFLKVIEKCAPDIPIVLITGLAYAHLPELEKWLKLSCLTSKHLHDCQHMADVLVNTRLAVSAAGGTQFELLACATPALLLVTAKNQIFASQQAAEQGWCEVISLNDVNISQLVEHCVSAWQQTAQLKKMHEQAKRFVTHDGAKHIVALMLQGLTDGK
ncbi:UDP-2,4-diacetamido-2,4,6-trideoxy-beta-L-altropyranose hydrolase [Flavobacterium sp. W21_SRS_FM6]|uniref:UDP-2,4-diacetamido-2,4, 6-trideoxy-beta-L-altropyranose hydrolase n=1 Tax=Flavobacterium sp. W21_SRS_FM6 TaxID=3240268 RepID=UPI003F933A6E